ncbi:MAG: TIGR00645 family protein [Alphaproteobacteria bacterium]
MKSIETALEQFMFSSRWLLAPLYVGLVLAIILLLIKFAKEFYLLASGIMSAEGGDVIIGILSLIDITLIANLLIIIVYAGYENFVSKMHIGNHEDRPDWMGHVDFSDLKIKVIGSIAAISAIELLKAFMNAEELSNAQLGWKVGIHLTFVASGVLFALMDRLNPKHLNPKP